eukprot:CAMPEP_0172699300 /NCGR_PEP_ID=MMETSP1074-20121228/30084_1 /TAXON_ID=2916 /ORGANISM="Ceratium fusus, Strain PA161109" /LENGTH=172 /DNA_ID=CAMNT_0013520479 /DNA_START=1 /DNA_END=517 /DNA_ORIENTATION=+
MARSTGLLRSTIFLASAAMIALFGVYIGLSPAVRMPGVNAPPRKKKKCSRNRDKTPELCKGPFRAGVCTRVYTVSPKKPNSAIRKVARLKLSTGVPVTAYIPGEGHNLQEFSSVIMRGGRRKDLIGVKYTLVRGVKDLQPVEKRNKAEANMARLSQRRAEEGISLRQLTRRW